MGGAWKGVDWLGWKTRKLVGATGKGGRVKGETRRKDGL